MSARLACLIHAASVRSEPESNSPLKTLADSRQAGLPDDLFAIFKTLQSHLTNSSDPEGAPKLIAQFNFQ